MLLCETDARKYKYDADMSYIALLNQPKLVFSLRWSVGWFYRGRFFWSGWEN